MMMVMIEAIVPFCDGDVGHVCWRCYDDAGDDDLNYDDDSRGWLGSNTWTSCSGSLIRMETDPLTSRFKKDYWFM